MAGQRQGVLVLGASGKVGRALRRLWEGGHWRPAAPPLFQTRSPASDPNALFWDMLAAPPPETSCAGILALAGVTSGDAAALAANTALARAASALGARLGVRVLIASTQAVYGPQPGVLTEDNAPQPQSAYARAKLEMEQAVAGDAHVCCLRLGNVAGTDQLFAAMAAGPVLLDRFASGQGPRRAMIGPRALAEVATALIAHKGPLPSVLNVAAVGAVAMEDVLNAAKATWAWRPAPATAMEELRIDVSRLQRLVRVPAADAKALVAEARQAGWRAAHDPV